MKSPPPLGRSESAADSAARIAARPAAGAMPASEGGAETAGGMLMQGRHCRAHREPRARRRERGPGRGRRRAQGRPLPRAGARRGAGARGAGPAGPSMLSVHRRPHGPMARRPCGLPLGSGAARPPARLARSGPPARPPAARGMAVLKGTAHGRPGAQRARGWCVFRSVERPPWATWPVQAAPLLPAAPMGAAYRRPSCRSGPPRPCAVAAGTARRRARG